MKRFIALVMAFIMVFAFTGGVLADEDVYVYVDADTDVEDATVNSDGWYTIGKVTVDIPSAKTGSSEYDNSSEDYQTVIEAINNGEIERYEKNTEIDIGSINFDTFGLKSVSSGAADYQSSGYAWHLDGKMKCQHRTTKTETKTTKQPTCTEAGEEETIITCTDYCKKVLSDTTTDISALGHDEKTDKITVQPTCTENGYVRTVVTCKRCGVTISDTTEVIPALGHDSEDKSITIQPTCTEDGSIHTITVCKRCGITLNTKDEVIPAHGHDYQLVDHKDATCTVEGYNYYECSYDKTHTKKDIIPICEHTPVDTINKVAATCTEDGYEETVTNCSVCGTELGRSKTIIPAHGHDYQLAKHKDPTCVEEGYNYYVCSYDDSHTKINKIPMVEHDYETNVITVDETCTEDGYIRTIVKCKNCGYVKSDVTETVPAHGHNYVLKDHKDATLYDEGYDYYECTYDASHNYTEIIPILGYIYVYVYVNPEGFEGYELNEDGMITLGRIRVPIQSAKSVKEDDPAYLNHVGEEDSRYNKTMKLLNKIERYAPNKDIDLNDIDFIGLEVYIDGAADYIDDEVPAWHLDGQKK